MSKERGEEKILYSARKYCGMMVDLFMVFLIRIQNLTVFKLIEAHAQVSICS